MTAPGSPVPERIADPWGARTPTAAGGALAVRVDTMLADGLRADDIDTWWGEKAGTFTSVDRTVHLSEKGVEPPGQARADLDIFIDYAKRWICATKSVRR